MIRKTAPCGAGITASLPLIDVRKTFKDCYEGFANSYKNDTKDEQFYHDFTSFLQFSKVMHTLSTTVRSDLPALIWRDAVIAKATACQKISRFSSWKTITGDESWGCSVSWGCYHRKGTLWGTSQNVIVRVFDRLLNCSIGKTATDMMIHSWYSVVDYTFNQYDEDIVMPQYSGTTQAWITIKGEETNKTMLTGGNDLLVAIDISGKSYIRIENLEITSDNNAPFRNSIQALAHITLRMIKTWVSLT